jgi:hypothetical protein
MSLASPSADVYVVEEREFSGNAEPLSRLRGALGTMSDGLVHITAGDLHIEVSGTVEDVEERIAELQEEGTWSMVLDHLRQARESALEAAADAIGKAGLPQRGAAFRQLIAGSDLDRRPEQVLAAIHYLREVEGEHDSPPRMISRLFEDAGIESPGNISLYINRLRDRGFLEIPESGGGKNRYVVLTPAGRAYLDEQSG